MAIEMLFFLKMITHEKIGIGVHISNVLHDE